jgi:hypothetical protein
MKIRIQLLEKATETKNSREKKKQKTQRKTNREKQIY